jgi:hypothetical protein
MTLLRILLPVILIACIGCSTTPPPPPSQAELQEDARLKINEDQATRLLDSGAIHAGQDLYDFLKLCQPYRLDFVNRYAFIEFYSVPSLYGLSFIAIDGKLVSARRWSCTKSDVLFETINRDQKQTAYAAYEARLFGYQR